MMREFGSFLGILSLMILRGVLYLLMGAALLGGLIFGLLWLFTLRANLPPFVGASVVVLAGGFAILRLTWRVQAALLSGGADSLPRVGSER